MEDMGLFNGDGHTWLRCDQCQGIYSGEGGIRVHQRTCQLPQADTSSEGDGEMDADDVTVTASQVRRSQIEDFVDGIANEIAATPADAPVLDVPVPPGEDRLMGDLNMGPDDEDVPIEPPPPPLPAVTVEVQDEWAHLVAAFQRPLTRLHHTHAPCCLAVLEAGDGTG